MIEINKKNTLKSLEVAFPHSRNEKIENHDDFKGYLTTLRGIEPNLDQARS